MEEFIAYLVKNVVNDPDRVDIRSMDGQSGTLIEIRVAPEDIGKVVGRKGNVIRSLRTLAMTIGSRLGRKIHLEVIQPEEDLDEPEDLEEPEEMEESNQSEEEVMQQ